MSNAFIAAVTTQTEIPPIVLGGGLAWVALAVLVAKACGAFQRGSIAGPQRLGTEESARTLLAIFFIGYFASLMLAIAVRKLCEKLHVDSNLSELLPGIVLETTAFVLLVALSKALRPGESDRLGLRLWRLPRGVMLGLATLFVLYPIVMAIGDLTSVALNQAGFPQPKTNEVLELVTSSQQRAVVILGILMAVIVAPFFEELAFRGFLQTILGRLFDWLTRPTDQPQQIRPAPRWAAVLVTAGCFAYVHRELAFMPPLFILAIGLGYLYERTGNLWATIVTHSVFNGMQILLALKLGPQ